MMFDLSYSVKGEDEPFKMEFKEVIFVMEDVDCASKVVYARKGASAQMAAQAGSMLTTTTTAATPEVSAEAAPGEAEKKEMKKEIKELKEEKALGNLYRAQSAPPNTHGAAALHVDPSQLKRNAPFDVAKLMRQVSKVAEDGDPAKASNEEESDTESDTSSPEDLPADLPAAVVTVETESASKKKSLDVELDKLNLSGLLNILDGVVDTPGRVVVMTTNHPEKLDPALIRRGRINKKIHLGFVDADTLLKMAKHYICRDSELPSGAQELAQELCGAGRGITPAWVEQCSAESEDFDGFVKQLRVLKNAALPGAKAPPAPPPKADVASTRW
ncbi:unnamed protein product [Durusdinium trenchii]|uniref:Mitochondrial chaperone BCS1 (H-BCS1) (BCS1-like protein) n=2 Tax=Durusdinium trenchii TaxID=1381693 RepID=A0ABP0LB03_9DINO